MLMILGSRSYSQQNEEFKVIIFSVASSVKTNYGMAPKFIKRNASLKLKYKECPLEDCFDSLLIKLNTIPGDTNLKLTGDYRTLIIFKSKKLFGVEKKYWVDRYGKFIDKDGRTFRNEEIWKVLKALIPECHLKQFSY